MKKKKINEKKHLSLNDWKQIYFCLIKSNGFFSKITGKHAASNLKYAVSGRLAVQASDIHPPYINILSRDFADSQPVKESESGYDGVPAFLIAVGCIMFAVAIVAMVYLCFIRRK